MLISSCNQLGPCLCRSLADNCAGDNPRDSTYVHGVALA